MKRNDFLKSLTVFIFLILTNVLYAQGDCEISATAFPDTIYCGQSTNLVVNGEGDGTVLLDEDFNTGSFGSGWNSTPGSVDWSNPCSSNGVDGTTHAWMGSNTSVPRDIVTNGYDLSTATAGVTICFDLLFASQGGTAPCEGPDEPDEGVYFQYSTDGGVTWTTIHYFDPNGGNDSQLTNWNNWCFQIPTAALTSSTQFRWHQSADSGADFDHWGIDNVSIVIDDVDQQITWGNPGDSYYHQYPKGSTGGSHPGGPFAPTSTTTYSVEIVTGSSDVCSTSVTVVVLDPIYEIDPIVNPDSLCQGDCATITGTVAQVLDPGGIKTWSNNQPEEVTGLGTTISSTVNLNVQGVHSSTITPGLIQKVCIDEFDFTGIFGGLTVADFEYKLVTPDGCEITLIPINTLTPPSFPILTKLEDVCFIVGGATDISTKSDPYSGTYEPADPFSDLNGCDPNGVWSIVVTATSSGASFGSGTFYGWNITFDNPPLYDSVNVTWSPSTGLDHTSISNTDSLNNQACLDSLGTTTYTITVDNGVTGCKTTSAQIDVHVIECTGCPNLVVNEITVCGPDTVDLESAIIPPSQTANKSYFTSKTDAENNTNSISNMVSSSGVYWVRAEDPSDPTCFNVYEINVEIITVNYTSSETVPTCNQSDGEIVLQPQGGDAPYTFSIDNGLTTETTGTFSNLPAGSYDIIVTDSNGCEATGVIQLVSANAQDPSFTLTDYCAGESNQATNIASEGGTFSIIQPTGDGATIDASTGEVTNGVAGTTYTVVYALNGTCPSSDTAQVTVFKNPQAIIGATPTEGEPPLVVEFQNNSTDGDTYFWNYGDGSSEQNSNTLINHTYVNEGTYNVVLVASSNGGCVDTASIKIVVSLPGTVYAFPNIFTPNADGENDVFKLIYSHNIQSINIIVLNRWGNVVYESDETTFKWNGNLKNTGKKCDDGTYFYKATIVDAAGEEKLEHGFVQLNRGK